MSAQGKIAAWLVAKLEQAINLSAVASAKAEANLKGLGYGG